MLDGVAAGGDRVLEPVAAKVVAAGLVAEPMRFVNQGLQNGQGIGQDVLSLSGGPKRIPASWKQLDPIRAFGNLIANGGACLLN